MTNLTTLVRAVLDDCDETDPRLIADLVIARLTKDDVAGVLHQVMVGYVASVMARSRTGAIPPVASLKVAGVRDAHAAWLRERVSVAPNVYRMLGDCSVADLRYAAMIRRTLATENLTAADQFDTLADALVKAKATTVRDLPARTLTSLAMAA